jgi:hypothetical protein
MTYNQLMQAARSNDQRIRERGERHFIRRLTSIKIDERLNQIERDVLGRMYGMNMHRVFELWRKGLPVRD